jgi:hypothetical protein
VAEVLKKRKLLAERKYECGIVIECCVGCYVVVSISRISLSTEQLLKRESE